MSDLVSVIVPTYNMATFLPRAIDSVLEGNYQNVEVIVVDDGSSDATPFVIDRYTRTTSRTYDPRVRAFRQPNRGKSNAVNLGLKVAEGSYVTFLDADDELTRTSLARRMAGASARRSADVVIGGFEVFNDDTVYERRSAPASSNPSFLYRIFFVRPTTPFHLNACLFSRDIVARIGEYDEDLDRCQDIDYAVRMLATAPAIEIVDEVVYRYRKHRTSSLSRVEIRLRTIKYRARVVWKNYRGVRRYLATPVAATMDVAKMVYEMFTAAGGRP